MNTLQMPLAHVGETAEIAPVALLKDLDKTTYDTSGAFRKRANLAVAGGLATRSEIDEARRATEAQAGSFGLNSYLRGKGVPADEITHLSKTFGDNTEGDNFLYPDAERLEDALEQTGMMSFYATKGEEEEQISKLRSVKRPTPEQPDRTLYDLAYIITPEARKGLLVNRAETPEGTYKFKVKLGATATGLLEAYSVLIVEDKVKGIEDHPFGWIARRSAQLAESQKGEVPNTVIVVPDLDPVTDFVLRSDELRNR